MSSVSYTDMQAFRAYVEEFQDELISHLFTGFPEANQFTNHEGVKGKKVLTELILDDIVVAWKKTFEPGETINFKPREIDVHFAKSEVQIYAQELEQTYAGYLRRTGQSVTDYPFQRYVFNDIMQKINSEQSDAFWRGKRAAVVVPGTTKLIETIDGILTHVADNIADLGDKVVETPGGAVTQANIIPLFEGMFDKLAPAYQRTRVVFNTSMQNMRRYARAYRDTFKETAQRGENPNEIFLDFGDALIRGWAGIGSSDRVVLTQDINLHYAYDGRMDATAFNFQQMHRALDFWADFKMGTQIGLLDAKGAMVINGLPGDEGFGGE